MRNLHLIYNKLSYSRVGEPDFSTALIGYNLQLTRSTFDHQRDFIPPVPGSSSFTLQIAYPGMLVGLSSERGVGRTVLHKSIASGVRHVRQGHDFSGSITLDYTSGQPYIPGSTVKGILRSYFRRYPMAVAEILRCPPEEVPELEQELFEGADVYFNAVVFDSDRRGRLLGRELVAAHKSATSRVQLLTHLKIRPGVRLQFRFMPTDGRLSAEKKLWLYRELLLIGGVGSRNRTGYGVLLETDETLTPKEAPVERDEKRRQCPHCLSMIFRLSPQGRPNTHCYRCKQPLPNEEETNHATI